MRKNIAVISVFFLCVIVGNPIAQWVPSTSPCNGPVYALAKCGARMFAGTALKGVYVSIDNGVSWTPADTGLLSTKTVTSFAVMCDQSGDTNIFAGTIGGGAFLSKDNGTHWTQVNKGVKATSPLAPGIRCFATIGTIIFAGSCGYSGMYGAGVYRSIDFGATWEQVNYGLYTPPKSEIGISVLSLTTIGSILFAGTLYGTYRSDDSGSTWRTANGYSYNGLPHDSSSYTGETRMCAVQSIMAFDSALYAACADHGIYISKDRGYTWTVSNAGLKSYYVNSLAAIGGDIFACAGGTYGCFCRVGETQPGGLYRSWAKADSGLMADVVLSVAAGNTGIFVGTSNGIYLSVDTGKTWTGMFQGIPPGVSVDALVASGPNFFAGSTAHGVWRSTNGGTAWVKSNNGLPTDSGVLSLCASGTRFYAGTPDSGVYLWNVNGNAWIPENSGLPKGIAVLSLASGPSRIFAGTRYHGVYSSSDNGSNWIASNKGLPDSSSMTSISIFGGWIFAGSQLGHIYRSDHDGGDWTEMASGRISGMPISSIAACSTFIVAGVNGDSGGVYRSTDDGRSWAVVNSWIPSQYISPTGYHYFVQTLLVSGTNVFSGIREWGVYLLKKGSTGWTDVGDGLIGLCSVGSFVINGTTIYAGTGSDGVWKRPLSEMVNSAIRDVSAPRIHPGVKAVQRGGILTFPWATGALNPRLEIFTLTGKRAALIQGSGGKDVVFSCHTLPAGTYIYKFSAGAEMLYDRIIVMK
jgi:hypothetical protein